jgi:imidazoleglycerol-phosphate dehydratase
VTRTKPDPEGLLKICNRSARQVLVYRRHVDDARAAHAAGVPFIGIASPSEPADELVNLLRAKAPSPCSTTSIHWRPPLPRTAKIQRDTKETQISGELRIEGKGRYEISTGIRFFDHMLELFTKHGAFDLKLTAKGDLDVDQHHTVEDVGIVIGQLFAKALGDRKGINRAGYFVLPMDETLAVVAVDLGGRPALVYKDRVKVRLVGDLQSELMTDFFDGFVHHAGANLTCQGSLRPLQPPQARSDLQMLGARHALRLLYRRAS